MKQSFKKLSATGLAAALVASSLVPAASAQTPETQVGIQSFVVEVDGKFLTISPEDYKDLVFAELLSTKQLKFVQFTDGKVYKIEDYKDAVFASDVDGKTAAEIAASALNILVDAEVPQVEEKIEAGKVDENGNVVGDTSSEQEVTVTAVSAINDTTIEVTFSDDTVVEIELEEALEEGSNEVTFEYEGKEYTVTVEFTLPVEIAAAEAFEDLTFIIGEDVVLPTTAKVVYEDETEGELEVTWDLEEVDFTKATQSPITVKGTVGNGFEVTVDVKIVSLADLAAAVKAVKDAADRADSSAFATALEEAALKLENVDENYLAAYEAAIKDAFSVETPEDIQNIINTVNEEVKQGAIEEAEEVIAAIEAANTTTKLLAVLKATGDYTHDAFFGVIDTTSYLAAYKTALTNGAPETLEEVQAIIDATNEAQVIKAIEKAETSKLLADVTIAQNELTALVDLYEDDQDNADIATADQFVFDAPAEDATVGALQARITKAGEVAQAKADLEAAIADLFNGVAGDIFDKLDAVKEEDETIKYVAADTSDDRYAAAYVAQLAADFATPAKKTAATVTTINKSLATAEKAVLAGAIEDIFDVTTAANITALGTTEQDAIQLALEILAEIDSTLEFETTAAYSDQYIKDLKATFNTSAKQKAATVKSIQNVITAANAKVEAGVAAGLVKDVIDAAVAYDKNNAATGTTLTNALAELDDANTVVKSTNLGAYATKLADLNPTKSTESTVKSTLETVNTEETAKLVKALVEAAKVTGDNETAVKAALDTLIADVEALDSAAPAGTDSFKGAVVAANAYKAAIAKLATTATVAQVDEVVVEVNTVATFNTELNKTAADVRTAITTLGATFELPTYENLSFKAKLDVANLVIEKAPKKLDAQGQPTTDLEFKSTADIVAAVEAQSAAQPGLVAAVNGATTRAQLSAALKAIKAFDGINDVDVQEQIIDAFWTNKNAATGTKFPYDSIAAILADVTVYTPAS